MDVTTSIHPDNRLVAERAARLLGLDIAGVDFLCPDISRSWRDVGGAVCEVNAQPGLRPHWLSDPARDINGEMLDRLSPADGLRIPVAAVAGGESASLVARQLYQFWQTMGKTAGLACARGIWVGGDCVSEGVPRRVLAGPRAILLEPTVEVAVMALDYRELHQAGHPCDRYGVIVLMPDVRAAPGDAVGAHILELQKGGVVARAVDAVVVDARDSIVPGLLDGRPGRRVLLVISGGEAGDVLGKFPIPEVAELVYLVREEESWTVVHWRHGVATPVVKIRGPVLEKAGYGKMPESVLLFAVATALAQGMTAEEIGESFRDNIAQPGVMDQ